MLVQGEDIAEAIRRARTQFSHEMPRLWDKIYRLDSAHFQVETL